MRALLVGGWFSNKDKLNMQRILILGAGTAGTMMANHLRPKLDQAEWSITIVDQEKTHYYQPGYPVSAVRHLQTKAA